MLEMVIPTPARVAHLEVMAMAVATAAMMIVDTRCDLNISLFGQATGHPSLKRIPSAHGLLSKACFLRMSLLAFFSVMGGPE